LLYTKSPSRGRIITTNSKSPKSRTAAVSPAEGVTPAVERAAQSSIRLAPPFKAAMQESMDVATTSMVKEDLLIRTGNEKSRNNSGFYMIKKGFCICITEGEALQHPLVCYKLLGFSSFH
jgi:hypothetical protein